MAQKANLNDLLDLSKEVLYQAYEIYVEEDAGSTSSYGVCRWTYSVVDNLEQALIDRDLACAEIVSCGSASIRPIFASDDATVRFRRKTTIIVPNWNQ